MRNATDPEAEPPPRFVAGGCDAELYGARAGYPKGDRATYLEVGSLVGSHSHLDEIFESRSRAQGVDRVAPRARGRAVHHPGGGRTPS